MDRDDGIENAQGDRKKHGLKRAGRPKETWNKMRRSSWEKQWSIRTRYR